MKRICSLVSLVSMGSFIVVAGLLQTGCEEAKGLQGLQVNPSSVVMATNGQISVFTVTGGVTNESLALPLTWRVSDEGLGRIVYSSGYVAGYQRFSPNGVNTIIVRDQYENEGYATVRQTAATYGLTLAASASSINVNEAATITITTESAQAPFSWRLASGPGSLVGDSGSRSAVYTGDAAGSASISVTDANGASGVIGIVIKTVTDDGGGGGAGGTGGAGGA
jgi:hypothetical protein